MAQILAQTTQENRHDTTYGSSEGLHLKLRKVFDASGNSFSSDLYSSVSLSLQERKPTSDREYSDIIEQELARAELFRGAYLLKLIILAKYFFLTSKSSTFAALHFMIAAKMHGKFWFFKRSAKFWTKLCGQKCQLQAVVYKLPAAYNRE